MKSKAGRSFEDKQAFEAYQKEASGMYVSTDDYLGSQPEIMEFERRVLCEWIADIAETTGGRINMCDSYQMAVSFIDRFCIKVHIPLNLYQLLGITSLFLANKFCDQKPLKARFFAALTDGDFSVEDIKIMEGKILDTLNWNCNDSLPCIFIAQYSSRLLGVSTTDRNLIWGYSNCFIEKMLYDYKLSRYRAPILAAAAFMIAAICVEIPESVVLDAIQQDFSLSEFEISTIDVHQCILDSFNYLTTKAPFRHSETVSLPDDPYIECRLQNNLKQAQADEKLAADFSVQKYTEKRRYNDDSACEIENENEIGAAKKHKIEPKKCVVEFGLVSPPPQESIPDDVQDSSRKPGSKSKSKLITYTPHTPNFPIETSSKSSIIPPYRHNDVNHKKCVSKEDTMFELEMDQMVPNVTPAGNAANPLLSRLK